MLKLPGIITGVVGKEETVNQVPKSSMNYVILRSQDNCSKQEQLMVYPMSSASEEPGGLVKDTRSGDEE